MDKQTRYSFAKNNLNAAIAMRTNPYGHTVLDNPEDHTEQIEVDASSPAVDGEFQPHIGSSGELVHNRSIIDSPHLQKFLKQHAEKQYSENSQSKEPQPKPVLELETGMLDGEFASVTDLDTYAKELDLSESEEGGIKAPNASNDKTKRAFASRLLTRFCVECGFAFESEKFCPHCGKKRTTYAAPN